MKKIKNLWFKIMVAITYLAMIGVNALANALPINGVTTGGVSNSYPNLFAPAGYAFSIWGLIYLLLGAHVVYQFILKGDKREGLLKKVGAYFAISSLANILWIFSWHYDFIAASLFFMLVILVCLIKIATILGRESLPIKEKIFLAWPFSVYFGWITVATIANATVFLVSIGWNGFGISDQLWTIAILLVGAAIGIIRLIKDGSIPYGLVLIWAYVAILVKHLSATGFDRQYMGIITTVVICLALFLVSLFFTGKEQKRIK